MGTAGIIGFRMCGNAKAEYLTYCHSDSYPSWLGMETLKFFRTADNPAQRAAVDGSALVDEEETPTPDQLDTVSRFLGDPVDLHHNVKCTWYEALRAAQGDWQAWADGLPFMVDNKDLLHNGSTEWAYVYDFERDEIEVYCDDSRFAKGRRIGHYNKTLRDDGGVTCAGPRQLVRIPVPALRDMPDEALDVLSGFMDAQKTGNERAAPLSWMTSAPSEKFALKKTGWLQADIPWEVRLSAKGDVINAELRYNRGPIIALPYAYGLRLQLGGQSQQIRTLLDSDLFDLTLGIFGEQARLGDYARVFQYRNWLLRFKGRPHGLPLLRLAFRSERSMLALLPKQGYFSELQRELYKMGLTRQAWRFLFRQPRESLIAILACVAFDAPSWEKSIGQINVLAAGIQQEPLIPSLLEEVMDYIRIGCGWHSWSKLNGLSDQSTPLQRRNMGTVARVVMRDMPSGDELFVHADVVCGYIKSLDRPIRSATWDSLLRQGRRHALRKGLAVLAADPQLSWLSHLSARNIDGVEVIPLTSVRQVIEESRAMKYVACEQPNWFAENRRRLFSLRLNGRRAATLQIGESGLPQWHVVSLTGLHGEQEADPTLVHVAEVVAEVYGLSRPFDNAVVPLPDFELVF